MALTHALSTNNYGSAHLIVSTSAANGTHTTIATAMADAVSGDTIFIRPGTYTENITLTAGVNLTAFGSDASTTGLSNVIISGKLTMTTAGTVNISGIQLQTNSDFFLAITGSADSIVNINNCYLYCLNNTGISYTTSGVNSILNIQQSNGDIGTTGIAIFVNTSSGRMRIRTTKFFNTGASLTASTASAGVVDLFYSSFSSPITLSSTASSTWEFCDFINVSNTTAATLGGGSSSCKWCRFDGGSASAVVVTSSTVQMEMCAISSSNTNAITGAGTLSYSGLSFNSTSSTVNVTTQIPLAFGASVPGFLAAKSAQTNNVTGTGTVYTAICDTEIYDTLGNYNNGTGVFTAPVKGKYELIWKIYLTGCTIAGSCNINIVTTARTYTNQFFRAAGASDFGLQVTCIADMAASDTASFTVSSFGEAGDTDDLLGNGALSGTWCQGRFLGTN